MHAPAHAVTSDQMKAAKGLLRVGIDAACFEKLDRRVLGRETGSNEQGLSCSVIELDPMGVQGPVHRRFVAHEVLHLLLDARTCDELLQICGGGDVRELPKVGARKLDRESVAIEIAQERVGREIAIGDEREELTRRLLGQSLQRVMGERRPSEKPGINILDAPGGER
jgi:hypothetical protein